MKLNKDVIKNNPYDWTDNVVELQHGITFLRSKLKGKPYEFNYNMAYNLMIKHRLEKIFSVYYNKHKKNKSLSILSK